MTLKGQIKVNDILGAVSLEEYLCKVNMALYGQIWAIKGKYNQIRLNAGRRAQLHNSQLELTCRRTQVAGRRSSSQNAARRSSSQVAGRRTQLAARMSEPEFHTFLGPPAEWLMKMIGLSMLSVDLSVRYLVWLFRLEFPVPNFLLNAIKKTKLEPTLLICKLL